MTDSDATPTPRHERTPFTEAGSLLMALADIFVFATGKTEEQFFETFVAPICNDDDLKTKDPDESADAFMAEVGSDEGKNSVAALFIGCVFCVGAIKAAKAGNERLAWTYIVDAERFANGLETTRRTRARSSGAVLARLGAEARHRENRAMKRDVIDAYLHGDFTSKDAAAEDLAGTLVPVKFRTVRDWLKGVTKDA